MKHIRRIFVGVLSIFLLFSVSACVNGTQDDSIDNSLPISSENGKNSGFSSEENNDSADTDDEESESVGGSASAGEEKKETYILTFKLNESDTGTQIIMEQGERLSIDDARIPTLPACDETGYYYAWDKDVSTLVESNFVTAVKKAKTYTVYLDAKGGDLAMHSVTVTFGEIPDLPVPTETQSAKGFMGWYYGASMLNANKAWSIDQDGITLNAVWSEGSSWTGDYS